jgi:hypothetical protein
MVNLASYSTKSLIDEVKRRIQNGSDIMKYHCLPGRKIIIQGYDMGDHYGHNVKKGSQRHLALKYLTSDSDLMYELLKRILNGNQNAFNQWYMFLASGETGEVYRISRWRDEKSLQSKGDS